MYNIDINIKKYSSWIYFYIIMAFVFITLYLKLLNILSILLTILGVFYLAFQTIEWKKPTKTLLNKLKEDYENELNEMLSGNDYILPEIVPQSKKRDSHHIQSKKEIYRLLFETDYTSTEIVPQSKKRDSYHIQSTYKERNNNKPINLNQILEDEHDFVIVGESGIGKTSLLYWIGLQLSQRRIKSNYIPLILTLKEISDKNTQEDFISLLKTKYKINNYNLDRKRILFLLDGLDQLNNYDNIKIILKRKDIFTVFKDYKIIITTRLTGYENVKIALKDQYKYLEIQPFDNERIKKYLGQNYYNEKFQKLFIINEELIRIPILLKLIKKLISENELNYIKNRADLYDKFIECLLKKQKNKDGSSEAIFNYDDIKDDLIEISYKSLENHQLESIPFKSVIEYLNSNRNKIKLLTTWCVTHDLIEKGENSFIYTHQSFQEYFASKKLKGELFKNSKLNYDIFKEKLEYFIWDDVWLFLIGNLEKNESFKIITEIEKYDYKFAACCLREYTGSKKDFQEIIDKLLYEIDDPEIMKILIKMVDNEIENALIDLLEDKKFSKRKYVINALKQINSKNAVTHLIKYLHDDDIRIHVIHALGEMGSEKTINSLIDLLKEDNQGINTEVGIALGKIGSDKAIEPLISLIKDDNPIIRDNAIEALGYIYSHETFESLVKLKLKYDNNPIIYDKAVKALDYISSDKAIEPLISLINEDDNPIIRDKAIEAMTYTNSDKAIELLVNLLNNNDPDIRDKVAEVLGMIGSDKAVKPLIKLLKNNDNNYLPDRLPLRKGISDNIIKSLANLLKNNNPLVSNCVAFTLGWVGSDKAVDPLINLLKSNDHNIRAKAALYLGFNNSDVDKAVEPLIELLNDDELVVQINAISTLKFIGSDKAINSLISLLKDDPSLKGSAAGYALKLLNSDRSVELLITTLESDIPYIRGNIAEALGNIGSDKAIKPLIKIIKEDENENREKASQALSCINSKKIIGLLWNYLNDDDPNVRFYTAKTITNISYHLNISQKNSFFSYLSKSATEKSNYQQDYILLMENMKSITGRRF